jgi:hypothetical protein
MHMGVDQTRHQGCAAGIDDGCPGWNSATNRMDVRSSDHDGLVVDDTLPVEDTRVGDGGDLAKAKEVILLPDNTRRQYITQQPVR